MRQSATSGFRPRPSGLIARTLRVIGQLLIRVALSLVISILIEWVGISVLWQEQGLERGREMIRAEHRYLEGHAQQRGLISRPVDVAKHVIGGFDRWLFELSRINRFVAWLDRPIEAHARQSLTKLHRRVRPLSLYLKAARQSTELFAIRLSILMLSLPVFFICGAVGLIDGLVQRDLRRWGGGRESSFVYHHAKGSLLPLVGFAGVIYLASPMSLQPAAIILPFALGFGLGIMMTARTFKKYL